MTTSGSFWIGARDAAGNDTYVWKGKFYQTILGCGGQENRPMAHQTVFTWVRLMGNCTTSSARVHSPTYVKLCKTIPGRGLWNSFLSAWIMLIISKVANVFSCRRDTQLYVTIVFSVFNRVYIVVSIRVGVEYTMAFLCREEIEYSTTKECYI